MSSTLFDALVRLINDVGKFLWLHKLATGITLIVCFLVESINNPQGFINFWLCSLIDLMVIVIPKTPDNLKLSELITDFAASYPIIGAGVFLEIMRTLLVILAMYTVVKMIKFVRG